MFQDPPDALPRGIGIGGIDGEQLQNPLKARGRTHREDISEGPSAVYGEVQLLSGGKAAHWFFEGGGKERRKMLEMNKKEESNTSFNPRKSEERKSRQRRKSRKVKESQGKSMSRRQGEINTWQRDLKFHYEMVYTELEKKKNSKEYKGTKQDYTGKSAEEIFAERQKHFPPDKLIHTTEKERISIYQGYKLDNGRDPIDDAVKKVLQEEGCYEEMAKEAKKALYHEAWEKLQSDSTFLDGSKRKIRIAAREEVKRAVQEDLIPKSMNDSELKTEVTRDLKTRMGEDEREKIKGIAREELTQVFKGDAHFKAEVRDEQINDWKKALEREQPMREEMRSIARDALTKDPKGSSRKRKLWEDLSSRWKEDIQAEPTTKAEVMKIAGEELKGNLVAVTERDVKAAMKREIQAKSTIREELSAEVLSKLKEDLLEATARDVRAAMKREIKEEPAMKDELRRVARDEVIGEWKSKVTAACCLM